MRAVISNSVLNGEVAVPVSKSAAHRALICSYLAGDIINVEQASDDISATAKALAALEADDAVIDCNESGSTLRFLIPVAAAIGKAVTFTGKGRLPERPIGDYLRLLPQHGVKCESGGGLPLTISGELRAGEYALSGDVSSQYVTGLLLALPLLDGDSVIILTSQLQSKPYVDLTISVMERFGVKVTPFTKGYLIKGNQKYKACDYPLEGDWSQAAFFLTGGAIAGEVEVKSVDNSSVQGDREIVRILRRFGAEIEINENSVTVKKSDLNGITVDVSDIPDLVPSIAVLGAYAKGKTVIKGGERLRLKESDRISSVVTNLKKMGVNATETPDGMIIEGGKPSGAELDSFNDHRIVMAFSIAALAADGKTTITGAESINKSYPSFFEDYCALGGKADVICDRK